MKHRKLRIAWSVASGVACLLLVALWVRSYWHQSMLQTVFASIVFGSDNGHMFCWSYSSAWYDDEWDWDLYDNIRIADEPEFSDSTLGFSCSPIYGEFGLQVPHWFLVTLSAAIAYVPWLPWRFRFSLRTLLIAMTVAAIGLGWIVYALRN